MKCNHCGSELAENEQFCPTCGAAVAQPQTGSGTSVWKIILASVAGLFLLICLSIVVYWGVTGVTDFDDGVQKIVKLLTPRENDVYYKNSYSVSDEKAERKTSQIVATVGDTQLTNGLLQVFYWLDVYEYLGNYGYDAIYSGLDYSKPLDAQQCGENGGTWQQYFLAMAIDKWHHYQALSLMAQEEGVALDPELQEELDRLREEMTQTAVDEGVSGLNALVQADLGPGCTFEDYENYMRIYYTGYSYLSSKMDGLDFTQEELSHYYDEHKAELAEQGVTKDSGDVMDVRHILIAVEGGTEDAGGEFVYSQQEWDTCRQEAQKILDQWLADDPTEDSFAQLAYQYSADQGSNTNGGLYTSLDENSGFVPEFIDWYMDESRQPGDYDLLQTEYGYHVMYFSGRELQWVRTCRELLLNERGTQILGEATSRYPMDIQYKKIALGVTEMNLGELVS